MRDVVIDTDVASLLQKRQAPPSVLRQLADTSRLFVTERTVEAHVTQIFLKLRLAETPGQHRRVLAVLAFLRT
jgi:hypothetical protein